MLPSCKPLASRNDEGFVLESLKQGLGTGPQSLHSTAAKQNEMHSFMMPPPSPLHDCVWVDEGYKKVLHGYSSNKILIDSKGKLIVANSSRGCTNDSLGMRIAYQSSESDSIDLYLHVKLQIYEIVRCRSN